MNKYLTVGIVVQTIFFLVVISGFYARSLYPDLVLNGRQLKLDEIVTVYVATKFDWYVSLIVVLGLIFAGISTIEGLIQSLSITITSDILKPIFGKYYPVDSEKNEKLQMLINKFVIIGLAVITIIVSYIQIVEPNLSVSVLALNGVYAYLAAAFVPVVFGTFLKNVPKEAPFTASILAILIHVYLYYVGNFPGLSGYFHNPDGSLVAVRNPAISSEKNPILRIPKKTSLVAVRNPAISSSMGILISFGVGLAIHFYKNRKGGKN